LCVLLLFWLLNCFFVLRVTLPCRIGFQMKFIFIPCFVFQIFFQKKFVVVSVFLNPVVFSKSQRGLNSLGIFFDIYCALLCSTIFTVSIVYIDQSICLMKQLLCKIAISTPFFYVHYLYYIKGPFAQHFSFKYYNNV